jgi:hypothetical protein
MEFMSMSAYLAECKAKEIEGETLEQAEDRARSTGKAVYWSGHRVSFDSRNQLHIYASND